MVFWSSYVHSGFGGGRYVYGRESDTHTFWTRKIYSRLYSRISYFEVVMFIPYFVVVGMYLIQNLTPRTFPTGKSVLRIVLQNAWAFRNGVLKDLYVQSHYRMILLYNI